MDHVLSMCHVHVDGMVTHHVHVSMCHVYVDAMCHAHVDVLQSYAATRSSH